jgi:hypothetical protein
MSDILAGLRKRDGDRPLLVNRRVSGKGIACKVVAMDFAQEAAAANQLAQFVMDLVEIHRVWLSRSSATPGNSWLAIIGRI